MFLSFMMETMNRILLVVPLTLLAAVATAAKVPNLTGTWKANIEKSTFPGEAPKSIVYKLKDAHEGFFMTETQTDANGQETTVDLKFDRGGKETVNRIGDVESRTTLTEGEDVLHEATVFKGPQGAFSRKSAIKLSPDGKTLTMEGVFSTPGGDTPVKVVLEKQ